MQAKDAATTDLRTIMTLSRVLGGVSVDDANGAQPRVVDAGGDDAVAKDALAMLAVASLLCDAVVEDGIAALAVLSPDGRILFANPTFATHLGHHPEALLGASLDAVLPAAARDAAIRLIDAAHAAAAQPVREEFELRDGDGHLRRIRLVSRASPLSPSGNVLCGLCAVSDGAAMASALREHDDMAVVSIDSALDAIVSMDATGAICAFNSAAERVFGVPRAQAIGRTVSEVMIPDIHRAAHRAGLQHHLATDRSAMLDRRLELTALHADGHEFPIEISVTWAGNSDRRRYTAFIRDVSERHLLLSDLRAAIGRLAAVVQAQQQLAASGACPDQLFGQAAEFARELLDGASAVFEPVPDAPTPAHDAAQTHEEWPTDRAVCRDIDGQSLAVAPLHAGGRRLGVLKVTARPPQRYATADAHALELFATSVAAVLQRRQVGDLQARMLAMQREFSSSSLALQPVMALMCERAQSLLGGDAAAIEWLDGDELVYVAASGWGTEFAGLRVSLSRTFTGLCATSGEALACMDAESDPRVDHALARRSRLRAMVVAPLRANDRVVGVLKVMSREPGRLSPADTTPLQILAESMGAIIQRRRDAEQIADSEAQYRMLFHHNPHPMWVLDVQTLQFLRVNAAALAAYGYSEDEFLAMTIHDQRVPDGLDLASLPPRMTRLSSRHRRRDGSVLDVEVSFETITFAGRDARLVMALDVTQRLRAEAAEAQAGRAVRLLSACNATLVRVSDESQLLDTICRIFVDVGGYALAGIGYATATDTAAPVLEPRAIASRDPRHVEVVMASWLEITADQQCPAAEAVRTNRPSVFTDLRDSPHVPWCRVALANGFHRAVALPLRSEVGAFGFLSLYAAQSADTCPDELALLQEVADNTAFGISAIRAETERKQFLAELAHGASHDAVTGLERYALLEHRLAWLVSLPEQATSVAIFDIDRFNSLNETLGHAAADQLLRLVGERLMAFASDQVAVAHFASDEFVVVMAGMAPEPAAVLAEAMRAAIAAPIDMPTFSVRLTATAGISHSPAHGRDARDLVRRAQAAMEQGKRAGRDCSHAFLTEQMQDLEDRALLGARLREAVDSGELRLHYQPQYAAATGRLTGFEALLRWQSADLGAVSPSRFIPIAETLGLMPVLGSWVLGEACRQARAWLDAGHRDFRISVNVSGQQLMRPGLLRVVSQALADFDLPAHVLDLELTESSLMENVSVVQGTLADLKALGITLSLDDFGTGYSSLAYLKHFSLDKLKIDQSFVRGLPDNADDAAIARTIVSMGHQLRLLVSAEGVETREQAEFLRRIGCDEMQGYHFGHPLGADDAARAFEPT